MKALLILTPKAKGMYWQDMAEPGYGVWCWLHYSVFLIYFYSSIYEIMYQSLCSSASNRKH